LNYNILSKEHRYPRIRDKSPGQERKIIKKGGNCDGRVVFLSLFLFDRFASSRREDNRAYEIFCTNSILVESRDTSYG